LAVETTFSELPESAAGALASPLGSSHAHPEVVHQTVYTCPPEVRKYVNGVSPDRTVTNGLTVPGARLNENPVQMFPNVKQAFPVTCAGAARDAGAVYKQLAVIVPTPVNREHVDVCGTVHDWPFRVRHLRVGVNCCDCETSSVGLTGVTAGVAVTGNTKTF
jgi:hypothetical protein